VPPPDVASASPAAGAPSGPVPTPIPLRVQAGWMLGWLVCVAVAYLALTRWTATFVASHPSWAPWRVALGVVLAWAPLMAGSDALVRLIATVLRRRLGGPPPAPAAVARAIAAPALVSVLATVVSALVGWQIVRQGPIAWVVAVPVMALVHRAVEGGPLRLASIRHGVRPCTDARARTLLFQITTGTPAEGVDLLEVRSRGATPTPDALVAARGRVGVIAISDSALALPDAELRALLAHQVGHLALGHARERPWALLLSRVCGTSLALAAAPWLHASAQVSAQALDLPLRAAPVTWATVVWASEVCTALCRALLQHRTAPVQEADADAFALDRIRDPRALEALAWRTMAAASGDLEAPVTGITCVHRSTTARLRAIGSWAAAHPRVPPPWPPPTPTGREVPRTS